MPIERFTLIGATTRLRHAHAADARAVRHRAAAQLLPGRGPRADRAPHGRGAEGGDRRRRARARSRAARAARRASPTGCCAACATTRRCSADGVHHARTSRAQALADARRRPVRPRRHGRAHPQGDHREVRRRAGRRRRRSRAAVGEDAGTIEEVYEPFLVQNGFLQRTPRGRVATPLAYRHFGYTPPPVPSEQVALF